MCVDHLVSYFPVCGRGASVGDLRTASAFTAFAPVVSAWPVAVFRTTNDPSDATLACSIAAVAAIVHGSSLASSPGVRCDR